MMSRRRIASSAGNVKPLSACASVNARGQSLAPKPVFDYATVQSMIEAAIANERRMLCESLGEEVGRLLAEERREAMRATRDELHMLKLEIAKLATESATLREALANERCRVAGVEPLTRRMN
jgi:hypothetical protein